MLTAAGRYTQLHTGRNELKKLLFKGQRLSLHLDFQNKAAEDSLETIR